jgi:hypothetical protein
MKRIPKTENALVLRTDFSDQAAWEAILTAIQEPVGEYRAYVEFLDDQQYRDLTTDQLLALLPEDHNQAILIVADRTAISQPDRPLLIVDLIEQPGRTFRAIPAQLPSVENNLSIANMDFDEFADAVDESGVFRGFPGE